MKKIPVSLFLILVTFSSCARSCGRSTAPASSATPTTAPSGATNGATTGMATIHPAMNYAYKSARELLISKADPTSGDRWTARFARIAADSDSWEITLAPEGQALVDRQANGAFILHLLDTLRTINTKDATLSGSPESFGLTQPRFHLRWKAAASGEPGSFRDFEIRIGAPAGNTPDSGFYAQIGGDSEARVQVVHGAALSMLERIDTFTALRRTTWATFDQDEIDEIELKAPKFYAQREGGVWTDRHHKPIKTDVASFLEKLTHLRVLQFVDDSGWNGKLLAKVENKPLYDLTLTPRMGEKIRIRVAEVSMPDAEKGGNAPETVGSMSSRPGAAFILYPDILPIIRSLAARNP